MCNTLIKLQVLLSALCVVSGLKQFVPLTSKSLLNTLVYPNCLSYASVLHMN